VPYLIVATIAALLGARYHGHNKSLQLPDLGGGVGNVASLFVLKFIRELADMLSLLLSFGLIVLVEIRHPEICNREDGMCSLKCFEEQSWVMEVGNDHFNALGCQEEW